MSSFLMVFQRIQLATADVSDKLFKATASGQDRYSTTATGQHVIGCGSRPRGGVCACWPVAECNQSMKPVHWSTPRLLAPRPELAARCS